MPRVVDYAVYDNLIVPLLLVDSDRFLQTIEDSENGKCEIVSCLRRPTEKRRREKRTSKSSKLPNDK